MWTRETFERLEKEADNPKVRKSAASLIENTLNGSTFRVKRHVYVPLKRGRNELGQFNGKNRKAYHYAVKDKTQPVTYRQLMAENIEANNALLARLRANHGG
jgi:hypothetical protein